MEYGKQNTNERVDEFEGTMNAWSVFWSSTNAQLSVTEQ